MANILFMMWPEPGHINPTLRIAKTLKSHGHKVFYAQLGDFEDYIRAEGLEFVPFFGELLPTGYQVRQNYSVSIYGDLAVLCDQLARMHDKNIYDFIKEVLGTIFEKVKPDLLLMDSYNGKFFERFIPVDDPPCILINPTVVVPRHNGNVTSKLTTLILCPEEFEVEQQNLPANYHHVEASCDMQRKVKPGFPWDRIDGNKKLLYCSLGTQGQWQHEGADYEAKQQSGLRFLQAVVDAMAGRPDWQLVMVVGHISAEALHSVPANAVLVEFAPQSEILKRASLSINHGGLNTVKDCILLGVPMLVFPVIGDQFGSAERVAFHKLGLVSDQRTASAESISSMITTIEHDPGIKSRVEAMQKVFLQKERESPSVKIIEDRLAERI